MADVFISYAQGDRDWVKTFATALEAEGFSVWWDPDLLPGSRYREIIRNELATAKAVIVVWSHLSVDSDWVLGEADEARALRKLVPALQESGRIPIEFRGIHTADLSQWQGQQEHSEFCKLVNAVRALVGQPHQTKENQEPASPRPELSQSNIAPSHTVKATDTGAMPNSALARLTSTMNRWLDWVAETNKATLRIIACSTIALCVIKYASYFANPNFDFWNVYWLASEWASVVIFAIFAFSKRQQWPALVRLFLFVAVALDLEQIFNIFVPDGPAPKGTLPFFIAYCFQLAALGWLALAQSPTAIRRIRPFAVAAILYYLALTVLNGTVTQGSDGIVWLLVAIMRHALEIIMVCNVVPQRQDRHSIALGLRN
jgi:hypothetical protein